MGPEPGVVAIALAAGGASGAAAALCVGVGVVVAEGAGLVDLGLAEGEGQQSARRVPMRRVQQRRGHRGRGPAVSVLDLGGGDGDQPGRGLGSRLGGNRGRAITHLYLPLCLYRSPIAGHVSSIASYYFLHLLPYENVHFRCQEN